MSLRLRYTRRAELDLLEIWKYIARDRPMTADEVLRRLDRQCRLIRDVPEMGRRRLDLGPEVRSFPLDRWLILYRLRGDEVVISRIVDGARHLPRLSMPRT
jgi:toxin ParE1/3/4